MVARIPCGSGIAAPDSVPLSHGGYLLLMLLVLAAPARGQSNYAVVTGTVRDAQQLPVAGATIELTAASTGAVRRVTTFEAPAEGPPPPVFFCKYSF